MGHTEVGQAQVQLTTNVEAVLTQKPTVVGLMVHGNQMAMINTIEIKTVANVHIQLQNMLITHGAHGAAGAN